MMDPGGEAEADTAQRFFLAMGIAPDRLVGGPVSQYSGQCPNDGCDARNGKRHYLACNLRLSHAAVNRSVRTDRPRRLGLANRLSQFGARDQGLDFANPVHNLNTTSVP